MPTASGAGGSVWPGVGATGKLGLTGWGREVKANKRLISSPEEPYEPNSLVLGWDLNKGHLKLKQVPMSKAVRS